MPSARWWKEYYRAEREAIGDDRLRAMIDRAEPLDPNAHAYIFPHTRLRDSGDMIARVVRTIIGAGRQVVVPQVFALGVLHGGREQDAELVRAARSTPPDPEAIRQLRDIYFEYPPSPYVGPRRSSELIVEEFSLDTFEHMLDLAAEMAGVSYKPFMVKAYPFLIGPTLDHLKSLDLAVTYLHFNNSVLVATGDMIHHGVGYGKPEGECRNPDDPETLAWAQQEIADGLELLLRKRDTEGFLSHCTRMKSDFRDVGPLLEFLARSYGEPKIDPTQWVADLRLVDYADVLGAPAPTWVAAALLQI